MISVSSSVSSLLLAVLLLSVCLLSPVFSQSSTGASYSGVQTSNSVGSAFGLSVWNVNTLASFAPPNVVQITWTQDSSDFMQGEIVAIDPTALTMTVDVSVINGPTGIVWSPCDITLVALSPSSAPVHNAAGSERSGTSIMPVLLGMLAAFSTVL
jgi:hypothetical protein